MKNGLTPRQTTFVKHIAAGNSGSRAAILSGYSKRSARYTASRLLTNHNILQHIEELFDRAGLSDQALIARLKATIDSGIGQKANNSDSIKGLKLAFELKGRLDKQIQIEATQEDETHMKLSAMSNDELADYLDSVNQKTQEVVARLKERRLAKLNGDDNKLPITQSLKATPSESEIVKVIPTDPQFQDTIIKRAVGVRAETKQIKQPTLKSDNYIKDPEDERFHQKISYPA